MHERGTGSDVRLDAAPRASARAARARRPDRGVPTRRDASVEPATVSGPALLAHVLAGMAQIGSAQPAHVAVDPAHLPHEVLTGWEQSDDDLPIGVGGARWTRADPLTDEGPRARVRWYRVRLDLSRCRGIALGVRVRGVRDVDRAYFDGRPIGGEGAFPPHLRTANVVSRVYALPTDLVNEAGPHVLALRVYKGPRAGPVLSGPLMIERLRLSRERWAVDQILVALACLALSLCAVFLMFFLHDRRERGLLQFSAFALLLAAFVLCAHQGWDSVPEHSERPFSLATAVGALLCATYLGASWSLLAARRPARLRFVTGALCGVALVALASRDVELLVALDRVTRGLALVSLGDLARATWAAWRAGQQGVWAGLAGHGLLAFAVVWQIVSSHSWTWFFVLSGAMLALMGVGLYRLALVQRDARLAAIVGERARLARELHDTLAQGYTGIAVQLECVDALLDSDAAAARAHLDRARRQARVSLVEARRSVWDLRDVSLQPADLGQLLKHVAAEAAEGRAVETVVRVGGAPRALPARVESHLVSIAREALANALRHARPRRVLLHVEFDERHVGLRVRDDGCGFDPERRPGAAEGRFGLLGMRERAEQIGGRLRVTSQPGAGAEVAVEVPLP